MRHGDHVWKDTSYAQEAICSSSVLVRPPPQRGRREKQEPPPLGGVAGEWLMHLANRPRATSSETVKKYRNSILSFARSIAEADEPPVLASMTRAAIDRWISQQRLAGHSAEGIASRLAAVKAFAHSYLYLEAEYTVVDLLAKVKRQKPEETSKAMLDPEERAAIFDVFERGGSYEDVRNDAFLGVLLATGLRYSAVLEMSLERFDRSSGTAVVVEKGGVERPVQLAPGAMKKVRRWLRTRHAGDGVVALWTTMDGQPLSYWGGRSWFQRLKKRSGVTRLHPHLTRHTFGQNAIKEGADPSLVQDMLGHKTAAMTQRYTASVRAQNAAGNMPRFSVV